MPLPATRKPPRLLVIVAIVNVTAAAALVAWITPRSIANLNAHHVRIILPAVVAAGTLLAAVFGRNSVATVLAIIALGAATLLGGLNTVGLILAMLSDRALAPTAAAVAVGTIYLGLNLALFLRWMTLMQPRPGHCPVCDYDLRGTPAAPRCPECGHPLTTPAPKRS